MDKRDTRGLPKKDEPPKIIEGIQRDELFNLIIWL